MTLKQMHGIKVAGGCLGLLMLLMLAFWLVRYFQQSQAAPQNPSWQLQVPQH